MLEKTEETCVSIVGAVKGALHWMSMEIPKCPAIENSAPFMECLQPARYRAKDLKSVMSYVHFKDRTTSTKKVVLSRYAVDHIRALSHARVCFTLHVCARECV